MVNIHWNKEMDKCISIDKETCKWSSKTFKSISTPNIIIICNQLEKLLSWSFIVSHPKRQLEAQYGKKILDKLKYRQLKDCKAVYLSLFYPNIYQLPTEFGKYNLSLVHQAWHPPFFILIASPLPFFFQIKVVKYIETWRRIQREG